MECQSYRRPSYEKELILAWAWLHNTNLIQEIKNGLALFFDLRSSIIHVDKSMASDMVRRLGRILDEPAS